MICGYCALDRCDECTGTLNALPGRCACAERQHSVSQAELSAEIRANNERIYHAYVRRVLPTEASK